MLAFTHNDRAQRLPDRQFHGKLPFEPMVIHNNSRPKSKSPVRKVLMKTVTGKPVSTTKYAVNRPPQAPKQWYENGKMVSLFDNKLRKNELQQAQRRINKKSFKLFVEEPEFEPEQQPIKEVQKKRLVQTAKQFHSQSTNELEHLKKLIQKQKQEKLKNDRVFEDQQLKLEKERAQLKMIEKQINKLTAPFKDGIPRTEDLTAVVKRQNAIPTRDISPHNRLNEQPEEFIQQRTASNARRLNHLINAKDKLTNYNNPLNYTPTLIPLLSRASYKIISTHISTLTELLIDDILLEQVLILEELEQKQQKKRVVQKRVSMVHDYMELVGDLVRQNDEIEHRLGKFDRVSLPNWYKSELYKPFQQPPKTITIPESVELQLAIPDPLRTLIDKQRRIFEAKLRDKQDYQPKNMKMMTQAIEGILDELIDGMTDELEKGAGEFVDIIFRNEFK